MNRELAVFALGMILWVASAVHAQVTTATVSGTVRDATGAVVPSATVVLLNEDTGISRTVQTDDAGRYSAPSLSLGMYRVTASREGFQAQVRSGIELTLARQAVVDFALQVGTVAQTLEVTGEAPLVQTTDSTVGYLVEDRSIRDLPLNGRDLTQLIFLNPGVTAPPNYTRARAHQQGYGPKISISGSRGEDNAYLLDGTYINDSSHSLPASPGGALLGVETTREFQVLTSGYSAQYGRALGGVFSAVSKSGTNEWHGSVYEYLRNSALDARDFFDRKRSPDDPRLPPFRRNQFGVTFSGPIARDKAFFFVAYEGRREALTQTRFTKVPDLNLRQGILPNGTNVGVSPLIAPYLALYPLPSPQGKVFGDGTADYIFLDKQPAQEDFGQGRFDHQFSEADSFFARFSINNATFRSVSGFFPPDQFGLVNNLRTRLLTLSETHIFSPRALSTFRFSLNRIDPFDEGIFPEFPRELLSVPSSGLPPRISPGSGLATLGGWQNVATRLVTNRFNFQNDMSLTQGSHSLQFGGMIERMQFNTTFPGEPFGSWTFRNLTDFLRGVPQRYRGTPPELTNPTRGFRQTFFALYFQDDWQVTLRLTLNLGLRWEPYTTPTEKYNRIANLRHLTDSEPTAGNPYWLNQSWGDLGPRFGFAWTPFGEGKTSVRGGFGFSYLPNDSVIYRNPFAHNLPFSPDVEIFNPQGFPSGLAAIATAQALDIGGISQNVDFDNLKSPRAVQYNVNVQQQLGTSSVLSIGYVGKRGVNLAAEGSWNYTPPFFNGVSLEAPANARRINPNFTTISYLGTRANSWYNGMIFSFQRRFSGGFQTGVSYTFSRGTSESDSTGAERTGSGSGATRDPYDLKASKGLSSYHQKNVLRVNSSYDLPWGRGLSGMAGHMLSGWELSGIVSLQSGQPFSVTGGGNLPAALDGLDYIRFPNVDHTLKYDEIIQGGPEQYFNPLAFTFPRPFELGNVGRNTLIGPGLAKWDASLTKNTSLNERWGLQFRAEFFNLLNRANFAGPSSNIFSGSGSRQGSAGQITSTVATSRQIQFGLKLSF